MLTDSHAHLDDPAFDMDRDQLVPRARDAGVTQIVTVGTDVDGSRRACDLAASHDGVWAAIGCHPHEADKYRDDLSGLRELVRRPKVVAIGETGLDFYRDQWTPAQQEDAFRAHISLAKEVDRTLVIHCRDAHDRVLQVLDDEGAPARVVMHCFSGDVAFASECNDRGFFASFAGNLTYKRNEDLRDAARIVEESLLLVETDAPFLAPEPFRGKPNTPAFVVHTAKRLADVRGIPAEGFTHILRANAHRAFVIAPRDLG